MRDLARRKILLSSKIDILNTWVAAAAMRFGTCLVNYCFRRKSDFFLLSRWRLHGLHGCNLLWTIYRTRRAW